MKTINLYYIPTNNYDRVQILAFSKKAAIEYLKSINKCNIAGSTKYRTSKLLNSNGNICLVKVDDQKDFQIAERIKDKYELLTDNLLRPLYNSSLDFVDDLITFDSLKNFNIVNIKDDELI